MQWGQCTATHLLLASGQRTCWAVWLTACAWLTLSSSIARADDVRHRIAPCNKATTSRKAEQEAREAIPFAKLTPRMQKQLQEVVVQPSVYRRLPRYQVECNPRLFLFLMRNPDVVIGIWDLMDVTQIDMRRTGQYSFDATDGAGTTSKVELVYGTPDIHIFYGRGIYEGPLFKNRIPGDCVVVVRSAFRRGPRGQTNVNCVLDMFLRLDHIGVEAIAKTFHPLLGKYADMNFLDTADFISRLSKTLEASPAGGQRLAQRLDMLHPNVQRSFGAVAASIVNPTGRQPTETARAPQSFRSSSLQPRRGREIHHVSWKSGH